MGERFVSGVLEVKLEEFIPFCRDRFDRNELLCQHRLGDFFSWPWRLTGTSCSGIFVASWDGTSRLEVTGGCEAYKRVYIWTSGLPENISSCPRYLNDVSPRPLFRHRSVVGSDFIDERSACELVFQGGSCIRAGPLPHHKPTSFKFGRPVAGRMWSWCRTDVELYTALRLVSGTVPIASCRIPDRSQDEATSGCPRFGSCLHEAVIATPTHSYVREQWTHIPAGP